MFWETYSGEGIAREGKGKVGGTAIRADNTLLDDKQWLYIQKRYHISPRELQVAKLVCDGLTNADIAKALGVRVGTVKTHLKSIFNKTHSRGKITMLLTFVDDVRRLYGSKQVPPIPIVGVGKPSRKAFSTAKRAKKHS
jgi:DNA-binding CsgD family transcriptional regulator